MKFIVFIGCFFVSLSYLFLLMEFYSRLLLFVCRTTTHKFRSFIIIPIGLLCALATFLPSLLLVSGVHMLFGNIATGRTTIFYIYYLAAVPVGVWFYRTKYKLLRRHGL